MLAEVYSGARQLWKSSPSEAGRTCIIHIGEMKALNCADIVRESSRGGVWVVEKRSENEVS